MEIEIRRTLKGTISSRSAVIDFTTDCDRGPGEFPIASEWILPLANSFSSKHSHEAWGSTPYPDFMVSKCGPPPLFARNGRAYLSEPKAVFVSGTGRALEIEKLAALLQIPAHRP
jgi:hypothetical protein